MLQSTFSGEHAGDYTLLGLKASSIHGVCVLEEYHAPQVNWERSQSGELTALVSSTPSEMDKHIRRQERER